MRDSQETTIRQHPVAGFPVRSGDWKGQETSNYDLFASELRAARWANAQALAKQTIEEASEPIELYLAWIPGIREFLSDRGVWNETAKEQEAALVKRVSDGLVQFDPAAEWEEIKNTVEEAIDLCKPGSEEEAIAALERSREMLLDVHDRLCDWVQGMVAIVALQLGEKIIGELWQVLMRPMFDGYAQYDIDRQPWEDSATTLLYVTVEALRGHLSGPERRGTIEFVEDDDRLGFRFSPCGSGGRNNTNSTYGTYPRTTDSHDWAWNLKGVCLYCAHCCTLSERNPIAMFGYPAREVEPPYVNEESRRDYCTWWIYKNPRRIPESVYQKTGNRKPVHIGSTATRAASDAYWKSDNE